MSAPQTAAEIDAATPATRDRWVDTMRVGSMLVVILGHWLMVMFTPEGQITNALAVRPVLQPLTWVLQVMPLFFLVGGVAHSHSLASLDRRADAASAASGATPSAGRAGRTGLYAAFFRARALRLLRPTLAFLAVWALFGVIAHVSGLTARTDDTGELVRKALVLVPQLLWFVGIYLAVCTCAPAMRRLYQRYGLASIVGLIVLAVLTDVVRFNGIEFLGNLNFLFVWLALHQFGFAWAAGDLTPRIGWLMFVGGYLGMALAITVGPYPTSMVGLPGDAISNMAPPSIALLAQGIGICGLAVLLRPVMAKVLARPTVWKAVIMASPFAMTAFLWHLTAMMLVLLGMRALNLGQPEVNSPLWWLTRPLLFLVYAAVTSVFVALFVRFDRGPKSAGAVTEDRAWVDPFAVVTAVVIFFGITMVSIVGVDVLGARPVFFLLGDLTPGVAFLVLGAGLSMLALGEPRSLTSGSGDRLS